MFPTNLVSKSSMDCYVQKKVFYAISWTYALCIQLIARTSILIHDDNDSDSGHCLLKWAVD